MHLTVSPTCCSFSCPTSCSSQPVSVCPEFHIHTGCPWCGCSVQERGARVTLSLCRDHKAVPMFITGTGCVCTQGSQCRPSPCHQPFPSALCSPSPSSLTTVALSSSPEPNYSCQSLACSHCPCKQPCGHPGRPGLGCAASLNRQFHLPRLL